MLSQDFRIQFRYGFWYAAAFIALVWVGLLQAVPDGLHTLFIPFGIFVDLAPIGFYFIAGQLMFEKGERTIYGLVSTPLTFAEYLSAKLLSLTTMSVVLTWLVVLLMTLTGYHGGVNWGVLTIGTILTASVTLLLSFIIAAPYDNISRFLIPSQLFLLPLFLPLLTYFGLLEFWLIKLIPSYSMLQLLKGGLSTLPIAEVGLHVGYLCAWGVGLTFIARKAFDKYVVQR